MPFITEELWGKFNFASIPLVNSDWPDFHSKVLIRKEVVLEVDWIISVVQNIRSLRAEMKLDPGIKIPVFMGYYFKNDSMQDKVVSVPAMLKMFDELGTSRELKVKKAFPDAGDHVITSYLSSNNYGQVTEAVQNFLKKIL